MLAVYAASQDRANPLSGLVVGDRPAPEARPGWSVVTLRTAGLNHHDVWSLMGVGLSADKLPMILGCDGAGVDESGREVIVHSVVASDGWSGDETLDPGRTLLSELHPGTLAEQVAVPTRNLVAKPEGMPWETAACLSTAWLTAYRMLFVNGGLTPGATVLVQGAGGGVATALIQLGSAAGLRMWVTSRDEAKGARALEIGADRAFGSGERLPDRVDAVMETVGAATWSHSVNSLKPGGAIVISGATSGDAPAKAELTKIFFKQLRVIGSTMGTKAELERLAAFVQGKGITPVIDSVRPLAEAREGFEHMANGDVFGKVIFTVS
ncbi:MAG: zinc-binding dehydrogenase [Actinomycetales bacterium]|jgi:NADPH:quinone reductase-like Zn-dependent oxidoreductase|uniref:Zinc-binding dehydrogenase n=1 Tax=Candidatus Phosphoribacter hodrii TaxID=2953743 RepID=A0A934X1W2_9MICO|nr:zinc-binding dehydrogenase [Candidatus Phosphoribacter hodrii]MBP8838413.1 zinc-binding dehydrogenase [Dermatophilaceae bacterium]OPZ54867.1 MAG: Alcohol dehydrogenase [bacterium ADurb.BinA028]MBK7273889.1 zinc-binding dehydrogenase [Candidatus Phosphoribacter hodrii]MBL0004206.1 zinc-binding dehydrogenase [Candidatus Phosphoribacter hodrii]